MTKQEFLHKETHDLIEAYANYGSIHPTFTLLFDDGSSTSIGLSVDKKDYKHIMQKICENPKVIACTFITEGWSSRNPDDTKSPSECDDKEEVIMLLYCSRENSRECHLYKPNKNGVLELISVKNAFHGRLSNPFGSAKNLTSEEKNSAILKFQESMRDTMCSAFEQLHYVVPMMFFLTNTQEQVSLRWIPEDEWNDRGSLKRTISSKCAEPDTLAFMLEFPVETDRVNIILVTDEVQEIFNYKINNEYLTLEFVNKCTYDGEFSDSFNIG